MMMKQVKEQEKSSLSCR